VENGYAESFNGKLRDELLNRELLATLWGVKVRGALAADLQSNSSPQCTRLSTTGTGGYRVILCLTYIAGGTIPVAGQYLEQIVIDSWPSTACTR
jgi:hypothetical protein